MTNVARACFAFGIVAAATLSLPAAADSPLSSTDLASAYSDLPAVREARETRRVDGEVLRALLGKLSNDRKAAIVNALGWGHDARANARRFVEGVAAARGIRTEDLRLSQLTAADRFVLGYLLALGEEPGPLRPGSVDLWGATPNALLDQAALALPHDFAVHYVRGLLEAQAAFSDSWCSVYLATQRVIERFPPAARNLRAAAVKSAQAYMEGYKKDCAPAPVKAPKPGAAVKRLGPEANQIYALARLGGLIVAGTQAGVVVWDPERREPVATQEESICSTVLAWGDSAWAGCGSRVLRYDGKGWKTYLHDPADDAQYYAPLAGPEGKLLVRYGRRLWEYDPVRDAFAEAPAWFGDAHDALVRRNGERWWIEFMHSVHGPQRVFAQGSEGYPGRDPRRLIEDALGRLWIADFDRGLYLYDERGAFERRPGLDDKASGLAVDAERGRTWMLHYTRGLTLEQAGAIVRTIDLGDLEYLRDLLLDTDGSVWVAGWNKLVRLRETPKGWQRDAWIAK